MLDYDTARMNMVESQLRPNRVIDERVLDAFGRVRREFFVPERLRSVAYADEVVPLGNGRFMMDPIVPARLVQLASVQPRDTVMVVGAATGYEAAILSMLARTVIALESDAELARFGRAALVEHRIASVTYVEEPLVTGHRARAPYDVILFTGAITEIPSEIAGQLAEGGRIGAVLKPPGDVGRATILTRTSGILAHRAIFDAATPLLPGFEPKPAFVF